ncbi:hypothetical protein Pan216_16120 [Planctomycetes bacterium Pan216]|uniref:Uncharacterized protein n=1 Tax=Kolteria novifilia TaxID=2527975 RepID=A0A518B1B0_9BACT|nr:hypothetical protein Pan216_16120 [Planctomycetes bacterium Pan216]
MRSRDDLRRDIESVRARHEGLRCAADWKVRIADAILANWSDPLELIESAVESGAIARKLAEHCVLVVFTASLVLEHDDPKRLSESYEANLRPLVAKTDGLAAEHMRQSELLQELVGREARKAHG